MSCIKSFQSICSTSLTPFFEILCFNKLIERLELKCIAEGGNLAEEVLSTIRTAQAFSAQDTLSGLYTERVAKARDADLKNAVWQGAIFGIQAFVMFSIYAITFSFGTTLINSGLSEHWILVSFSLTDYFPLS